MTLKWFNSLESINWTRLWWILGMVTVFWGGLTTMTIIYPAFDKPWKLVNIFLTALLAAILFAARGTKYVTGRTEPPADGKP
jgi:hypothetical protein